MHSVDHPLSTAAFAKAAADESECYRITDWRIYNT